MAARTTLWQAIERQRLRRTGMLGFLLAIWVLGSSASSLLVFAALDTLSVTSPLWSVEARLAVVLDGLPQQAVIAVVCSVVFGVAYVAVTTRRSVYPHLISIDACPVAPGEHADTVSALRDMALAAGINPVPRLYVIPDRVAVNAFVMGRTSEPPIIVVTAALVARGDIRLKRAVFANLLARFSVGGVRWTTDLFKVMHPIRIVLAHADNLGRRALDSAQAIAIVWVGLFAVGMFETLNPTYGINLFSWGLVLLSVTTSVACLIATLHGLDRSYRGAYRRLVYSADADGLMLLKDPEQAAAALKAVLNETTWLAGGWRYLYLTYADADLPALAGRPSELDRARLDHLSALAFPAQAHTIRPLPLVSASESLAARSDA